MINDFKLGDNYSSIFEERPLIRNISFEMDKGKHLFLDNKGSNYVCNIYGDQKPKFQYNISGCVDGKQRKFLKHSKSLSDILISKVVKHNKNPEEKIYLPSVKRFEGYAHFPRPICPPFGNLPGYIMEKRIKRTLKNKLLNSCNIEENKILFKKDEENKGLSYITSTAKAEVNKIKNNNYNSIDVINSCRNYNKDKKFLLNLIDETCNDTSVSRKNLGNHFHTIRALNHLKKKLINNDETSLINGRRLKPPNRFIIKEYKILKSKLFNEYKSSNNYKNQHKSILKNFNELDLNIKKITNKNKSEEKKFIIGRNILDKLSINKINLSNNFRRKIFAPTGLNKSGGNLKYSLLNISRNKETKDLSRQSSFKHNKSKDSKNRILNDDQETKESLSSRPHNNKLLLLKPKSFENSKVDDIAYISGNFDIFKFKKNINYMKNLQRKSITERRLLEGYKFEEPKSQYFRQRKVNKLNLEDFKIIYKKELKLLEKCNPIYFELQKKHYEQELERFKRKKEFKKLTEKLKMKAKILKIKSSGKSELNI